MCVLESFNILSSLLLHLRRGGEVWVRLCTVSERSMNQRYTPSCSQAGPHASSPRHLKYVQLLPRSSQEGRQGRSFDPYERGVFATCSSQEGRHGRSFSKGLIFESVTSPRLRCLSLVGRCGGKL